MNNPQLLLSIWPPLPAGLLVGRHHMGDPAAAPAVALAKPNARSSHRVPTPQGAGIAVIAATLIVVAAIVALAGAG